MSLRGIKPPETERKVVTFRCPPALREYIENLAEQRGTDMTEVIVGALDLDRDLGAQLDDERGRLAAYAQSKGLDVDRDLPLALADLIRSGLDAAGIRKKK